jgi:hypothetical protein
MFAGPIHPCGSPQRAPRRGNPRRLGHETSVRFGGRVIGDGWAWKPGEPEPERSLRRPERWSERASREKRAGTQGRPGASCTSSPPPTFARRGRKAVAGRACSGEQEPQPQGREWLKQATGFEEEQTVQAVENGEGGPKRVWKSRDEVARRTPGASPSGPGGQEVDSSGWERRRGGEPQGSRSGAQCRER